MFRLRGTRAGVPLEVSWDKGEVAGDQPAILLIEAEASLVGSLHAPGMEPWEGKQLLEEPWPFYMLANRVLEDLEIVEGEVPPLPEIPEGAIP